MNRRLLSLLLVAGIGLIGLVLNSLLGYMPNLYPDLFTEQPQLFWGLVSGCLLVLAVYGLAQWQHAPSTAPLRAQDTERAHQDRRAMLEAVWHRWIDGVLNTSLYQETLIALDLQTRPDAVRPPRTAVVQRPHQADQLLPPDQPMLQVFDDAGGAVLILGAPGSGKTTLLLELGRDLIERAGHDPTHPIPVVFLLSSWVVRQPQLAAWLVEQLVSQYAVRPSIAADWIASNRVLPLLDGLDEVAPSARAACVAAINAFRAPRGNLPMVVCSRIADYDELSVTLRLNTAIVVQPLSRPHVRQYMRAIGFPITPNSTSPLWNLLTTPLMLNIATLAYVDRPDGIPLTLGDDDDPQEQLIAAYIERKLELEPGRGPERYSTVQTRQYLSWLAWQMQRHNQTSFYLEYLQPTWLPRRQRWLPPIGMGLLTGLLTGVVCGWLRGPEVGTVIGGLVGLYSVVLAFLQKSVVAEIEWSWRNIAHGIRGGAVVGLIGGLGSRAGAELFRGNQNGFEDTLLFGLWSGLLMWLLLGWSTTDMPDQQIPTGGIRRSGQIGLTIGLIVSVLGGVFLGGASGFIAEGAGNVWHGFVAGLGGGCFLALLTLASQPKIDRLTTLNTAVVFGLMFGISGGVLIGLRGGLGGLLMPSLISGLLVGLVYGGKIYLQHYLVRVLLGLNALTPWVYVPFLDHAAARSLLRKVGGGYIFIHRLLLEHFAKHYQGRPC